MNAAPSHLDAATIEKKRRELLSLRDALRKSASGAELEEAQVKNAAAGQPRESEEDAQNLDAQERDGLLVARSVDRLALVERALAKIDAGTYGISDISGKPIPIERLDVVPEAINTMSEQEASERIV